MGAWTFSRSASDIRRRLDAVAGGGKSAMFRVSVFIVVIRRYGETNRKNTVYRYHTDLNWSHEMLALVLKIIATGSIFQFCQLILMGGRKSISK